jgi:hypothetical protein
MDLKTYIKTYLEERFKKKWIGIDYAVTLKQLVIYCKKYEVTKSHVTKALKSIMSEPGVRQFIGSVHHAIAVLVKWPALGQYRLDGIITILMLISVSWIAQWRYI